MVRLSRKTVMLCGSTWQQSVCQPEINRLIMVLSFLGQINKVLEEVSALIILVSLHNAGVTHAQICNI